MLFQCLQLRWITLSTSLALNYALETLHISFSTLNQHEATVIAQAIANNTTLKDLSMKANGNSTDREATIYMIVVKSLYCNKLHNKARLFLVC